MLNFAIDAEQCVGCGACAADCPHHVLAMREGRPVLTDEALCLRCQHCLAVCPTGALSLLGHRPDASQTCAPHDRNPDALERLIAGRRSIRRYKDQDVDPALLRRALDTAWHAPTGGNSRQLRITVIDNRRTMDAFRTEVYDRLTRMVEENTLPECRLRSFFLAAPAHWKAGEDTIFRTAPHAVFVSAPAGSLTPEQDPIIWLSYFELAAHSLGIGTVWCGILHYALLDVFPDLPGRLGIPASDRPGYAMLFGYPAVRYARTVDHGQANVQSVVWQPSHA